MIIFLTILCFLFDHELHESYKSVFSYDNHDYDCITKSKGFDLTSSSKKEYPCKVIVIVKVKVERLGHHNPEAVHKDHLLLPEVQFHTPYTSSYAIGLFLYSAQLRPAPYRWYL